MFNSNRALNEGWDLFDLEGRLVLQRIDSPSDHADLLDYDEPKFPSDAHALIFVAQQAANGSEYHMEALHMIGMLTED